jgi:hypothetical protein
MGNRWYGANSQSMYDMLYLLIICLEPCAMETELYSLNNCSDPSSFVCLPQVMGEGPHKGNLQLSFLPLLLPGIYAFVSLRN